MQFHTWMPQVVDVRKCENATCLLHNSIESSCLTGRSKCNAGAAAACTQHNLKSRSTRNCTLGNKSLSNTDSIYRRSRRLSKESGKWPKNVQGQSATSLINIQVTRIYLYAPCPPTATLSSLGLPSNTAPLWSVPSSGATSSYGNA